MSTREAFQSASPAARPLNIDGVRADFPILHQQVNGHPLAYLDNAASAQRPRQVIDAVRHYYERDHANVHRGVHTLSQRATGAYEGAREKLRRFVNARSTREIVYVRGTTEAINLVAQAYGRPRVGPGDEIVVSWMEHHSNIVPWQLLCEQTGATLRPVAITDEGELDLDDFARAMQARPAIVALIHVSNALGTINPVQQLVQQARAAGAVVILDGAQATPHLQVDVQALDCDFYAFSGHKMFGPTGIGVLYGRERLLGEMPPYQGGGEMIRSVSFQGSTYAELPHKFEAGTPNIAGAVGLGAAVDYLEQLGMDGIGAAEAALLDYGTARLQEIPGLRIIGTARNKASVLSFVLGDIHAHDLGTILDSEGIAVRTGHHCAMPVMERFGVPATARASLAFYNTREEIDRLARGLHTALEVFA